MTHTCGMDDEEPSETPPDDDDAPEAASPDGAEDQGGGSPREPRESVHDLWSQVRPTSFELPDHILRGFQLDTSHLQSVMAEAAQDTTGQLDVSAFRYGIDRALLRALTGTALTDQCMKGWSEVAGRLVEPLRDLGLDLR